MNLENWHFLAAQKDMCEQIIPEKDFQFNSIWIRGTGIEGKRIFWLWSGIFDINRTSLNLAFCSWTQNNC